MVVTQALVVMEA
jgi:hypothetical protein